MLSLADITPAALIPFLDPEGIISGAGPWALLVVCLIVFAETGLLVGFLLPGDTLLVITGLLTFPAFGVIDIPIWLVCLCIAAAAFLGGEVGYLIGHKGGPRIFERKESGFFSIENVKRTNAFFDRFGPISVILARFVPVVRTITPLAAGVGHMDYKKYSLYNAIGALIWGAGLTYFGYLLGYVPPIATFVKDYIDVILLGAVLLAVIPTVWHYIQARRKAATANKLAAAVPTDDEVEELVLNLEDDHHSVIEDLAEAAEGFTVDAAEAAPDGDAAATGTSVIPESPESPESSSGRDAT